MPIYPIGFSITTQKIVTNIPLKTRLLSPIIPGNSSDYTYHREDEYYQAYRSSWFAITVQKSGWDCMRHYEILANGCIPLFIGLEECPLDTMVHFPKQVILMTNAWYENDLCHRPENEIMGDPGIQQRLHEYVQELLAYTRDHLTNYAMSTYMLLRSGHTHAKRMLVLSGCIHPDYLRCNIVTGLKQIYGQKCHDFPRIDHLYDDYPTPECCYGKGFSYTRVLDKFVRHDEDDVTLEHDIRNHVYDVIIYGSFHRGVPYWNWVQQSYLPHEIILLCGEDHMTSICTHDHLQYSNSGYHTFVREL